MALMELCRLCQCHSGRIPMACDKELIKKISEVTKIEVTDEINMYLPTYICISCQDKIVDIYNFIQTVQKVDKNLRNAVRKKCFLDIDDKLTEETSDYDNIMQIHSNSHKSIPTQYKCPICFKYYNRLTNYNAHKKCHPELYCNRCSKVFDEETECKGHECDSKLSRKNNDSFKRKRGRKTKPRFKMIRETEKFSTVPQEGDTFQCNNCDKIFGDKNSLQIHLKVHKNFMCDQENCSKQFPSAYSLKIHVLNHLGKRPYLCVTCGKSFTTKNSLTCHEKTHSSVKSYRCEPCDIGFSVRSNLRAHVKKYHEGIRFYCSQCTKEFLTRSGLDRHEKIHGGVKEFKCERCTSAFYTKKELLKHQIYHTGLKVHKCEECFKTFFERHHLVIHLRSHSGERPYVCKIPGCGKSFTESQKLKRHHTAKHNAIS